MQSDPTGISCSYRVESMPLGSFMRRFSADTGLSVVWAEQFDDSLISLNLEETQAHDVLLVLSRRLNCSLAQFGSLYFLGDPKKSDRACYTGQVLRASKDEIRDLLLSVTTPQGAVTVWDDGAVLVVDDIQSIRKVDAVIRSMSKLESSIWAVQFYIVQASDSDKKTVGADIQDQLSVSSLLSSNSNNFEAAALLNASFRYDVQNNKSNILAKPLLLIRDGKEAKVQKVETIPIPQFTTSDQGTVTVSGYDYIDVGFSLNAKIRDWGNDKAGLNFEISMGEITGYINDSVPLQRRDIIHGDTIVKNGGVYLIGALQNTKEASGKSGFFGTLFNDSSDDSTLKVWVQVIRIS
tara:strand:+ start:2933 stop:3985 length:1053 start_codon:yes stop_codon:yes gene_type:complete